MRVALVDYGMGNLLSVRKALQVVGLEVVQTSDPDFLPEADAIVLPGVGAFRDAVRNLKASGIWDQLKKQIERGKPFLGICLGLQLLFERSYEFGEEEGLGVLRGEVVLLPHTVRVPHIGWNQIFRKKDSPVLEGVPDGAYLYFVHSYHVVPKDPSCILTVTDYGIDFVSSVEWENVLAVQFHPEKSQRMGLRILKNWAKRIMDG